MTATTEPEQVEHPAQGLVSMHWTDEPEPSTRSRATLRRAAVAVVVFLLVTGLALTALGFVVQGHLGGKVERVERVFAGLDDRPARPSGAAADSVNILVMGTDRRSDVPTTGTAATSPEWIPGAQRTDTIMVLHVDADRRGASLVSIPRDSWVDVPGHGMQKVNAAFSLAGPSLAVQTVEQLTGLRIDHLAVVDWSGIQNITDALGGVTLTVPRTVEDPANNVVWTRGRQTLDGAQALLYVRQRYGLPNGDLDRVRRQQAYLVALMRSGLRRLGGHSPFGIYDLLDAVASNVTVDAEWEVSEMRSLLIDLRDLRATDLRLVTVPVAGFGDEDGQSVVRLDDGRGAALWRAVRDDRVDAWATAHAEATLSGPAD